METRQGKFIAPQLLDDFDTLVITDLDGTLLDDSYALPEAAACLDDLSELRVLAVPASSKTLAELLALTRLREASTPLIFENGAGIAWPTGVEPNCDYAVDMSGMGYAALCDWLDQWRQQQGNAFVGFADMSAAEVAVHTGLPLAEATLAKQRQCSEPIIWQGSDQARAGFETQLKRAGLTLVGGGRFLHVAPPKDKATAAAAVLEQYRAAGVAIRYWLACGDSNNDQTLLDAADAAAVFPNRQGRYLSVTAPRMVRAPRPGVSAWRRAVEALLQTLPSTSSTRISAAMHE